MAEDRIIDLAVLTGNQKVSALTGKERGVNARTKLLLDDLDDAQESVIVRVPEYLDAISSSFFLGLFSQSLRKFPNERAFLSKYKFDARPSIMEQILNGIRNGLIDRGRLVP